MGTHIFLGKPPANVEQWIKNQRLKAPLCFTATQANSTIRLNKVGSPDVIYLETSTDGSTWTDYSWTNKTGNTLTLANIGDKVYFRAKTENPTIGSDFEYYYQFVMSGKISASGNIQTLLKADGSRTDAPACCYANMFNGCSSLTTTPILPATTLAGSCYYYMFNGCTSLTSAPVLPATTLAEGCYSDMFSGCTSLTTAPALPATTLAYGCYYSMFDNCSSLTTTPMLPATTLVNYCYYGMFSSCTSLMTAQLLATTFAENAEYCCVGMFHSCSNLVSINVNFTAWDTNQATDMWVESVAPSGTFTCPSALPDTRGVSNIPEGWTRVNK